MVFISCFRLDRKEMKFKFTANEKLYLSFSMWDRTVQNKSLLEKKKKKSIGHTTVVQAGL